MNEYIEKLKERNEKLENYFVIQKNQIFDYENMLFNLNEKYKKLQIENNNNLELLNKRIEQIKINEQYSLNLLKIIKKFKKENIIDKERIKFQNEKKFLTNKVVDLENRLEKNRKIIFNLQLKKKEIENKFIKIKQKYNNYYNENKLNEQNNYSNLNKNFDYVLNNHNKSNLSNNDYLNNSLNNSFLFNNYNENKIFKELPKISNVSKSQKNIFLKDFYFPSELIQTKKSINQVNKLMEEVIKEL